MMNSHSLRFATVALVLTSQLALAHDKKPKPADKPDYEISTSHDTADHDPTAATQIHAEKERSQKSLFLSSTGRNFHRNAKKGMQASGEYGEMRFLHPEVLDYLWKGPHQYYPTATNGIPFVNAKHEFAGTSSIQFGYCWGVASLVRNFATLAFFDASLPKEESIEAYKAKIDAIIRGEAVVIPGYENLRSFSSVPEIELYLKYYAMELWKTRAVRLGSLGIARKTGEYLNFAQVDEFMAELEERLSLGELPKIVFASMIPSEKHFGLNADIHIVLVNGVEHFPDGSARIHLWDANFYSETLMASPKYLEVSKEHGISYAPWYEPNKPYAKASDLIARVIIAPENDDETVKYAKSLKAFCDAPETAHYCCK